MNITERKKFKDYPKKIQRLFKVASFKNIPVKIHGSSSRKNELYFSDYDLYSSITKKYTVEEIYEEIIRIIDAIDKSNDSYLMEIKIQTKDGKKIRWTPDEMFTFEDFKNNFKNVAFLKIDYIIWDSEFVIVDIAYFFEDKKQETPEEKEKELKEEIKSKLKDKQYYKSLKRIFSYYSLIGDQENILKIHKFLNSEFGKLYKDKVTLEAIQNLSKYYDNKLTHKRIIQNLKKIGIDNVEDIEQKKNEIDKIINKEAKKFIDTNINLKKI